MASFFSGLASVFLFFYHEAHTVCTLSPGATQQPRNHSLGKVPGGVKRWPMTANGLVEGSRLVSALL